MPPQDYDDVSDLWSPYKLLLKVVKTAINNASAPGSFEKLKESLQTHKQNFITLLKNPPKTAKTREDLEKATKDGIDLPGAGNILVNKDLVKEATIISDMYDLNELIALDLLCTATRQMPHHPGNSRGLTAILLYYDGRKVLVETLKALVEARRGFTWIIDCPDEVQDYISQYLEDLAEGGLISKVIDLIDSMDWSKEISLLHQNRALGGFRHQHEVMEIFEDTKKDLANIVFCWSAQSGLPREPALKLIDHLKKCSGQNEASGKIDDITLILEIALLYALDLILLQRREDSDDIVQKHPLIQDMAFFTAVANEFSHTAPAWQNCGLQALSLFAWGVSLATLKNAPLHLHPEGDAGDILEEDTNIIDSAIQSKVFEYLHLTFLENETIYKQEYYVVRLHSLIVDFIVYMPLKVKDLKQMSDETAHTIQVYTSQGLDPPSHLVHHFEHFLSSVARLYQNDYLHLTLTREYWGLPLSRFLYQAPLRQAALLKFVCLSGDHVSQLQFIPYLKMLTSLSSSQETAALCLNRLKSHTESTISWDHFFSALNRYYTNLRQELPPSTDTVYRTRSYPRGITPQEIQGLQAVLGLIRTVAENDELARVTLSENPNWNALVTMVGLVTCSVPIPLKAELILTAAAFAKSPSIANNLWNFLEAAQIISTIPSTSSYQPRGVQTELEEVESRNEEFPLTRSILHLLDVLTDVPIPSCLGLHSRTPGFDPYLQFIVNSVLLRFNTRSYKNPSEKWQVAELCLKLLLKFVTRYQLHKEDFVGKHVEMPTGNTVHVSPPPGFHLLIYLNSKSDLLRLVLSILHEGCQLLDNYSPFPGKSSLENSTRYCLELLDKTLSLQHNFFELLLASESSIIVTGLSKLLFDVNPRSGQPDHLLNITKYVTYINWLPHHALASTSILLAITKVPSVHMQLISLYTSNPTLTLIIRHGFVECLETEQEETLEFEKGDNTEDTESFVVQIRIKEYILMLLQQCLNHPAPNITHYLLGFDLYRDTKKMIFHQAGGATNFPRTCLHSVITLLDKSLDARSLHHYGTKSCVLEKAYSLIYHLCANAKTMEPVLRFLHASHDFLYFHVLKLPFISRNKVNDLNEMAWLLRTVAIEIKLTASKQQHSLLGDMVKVFVDKRPGEGPAPHSESLNDSHFLHQSRYGAPEQASNVSYTSSRPEEQEMLLHLLHFVEFSSEDLSQPQLDHFNILEVVKHMKKLEVKHEQDLKLINLKALHSLLKETAPFQSAGQRLSNEIQSIMTYALKINNLKSKSAATVRFMESWRQVTEIIFSVTPTDIIPLEKRIALILECVHLLLSKVSDGNLIQELEIKCSNNLALLLTYLRNDLTQLYKLKSSSDQLSDSSDFLMSETNNKSNALILKDVLSNILKWIKISNLETLQKLRSSLYTAVLNFLCIAFKLEPAQKQTNVGDSFVTRLDNTRLSVIPFKNDRVRYSILEVLLNQGEYLIDSLCHDSINSSDICKMVSLSCLSALLELDIHGQWLNFLFLRNHIKHVVECVVNANGKLIEVLDSSPSTLAPLYVYESQMALLCRIASTAAGAETLLLQGGLTSLSCMTVFDKHPEIRTTPVELDIDFIPSGATLFTQIFFPALNLCKAVLMSLTTENQSCISQVIYFLMSHIETVYMVLRAGSPYMQSLFLSELAKLTAVIARTSHIDMTAIGITSSALPDIESIKDHIFQLLPRFVVSDLTLREIGNTSSTSPQKKQRVSEPLEVSRNGVYFFQVAYNVVHYCRNLMACKSLDARATKIIFKPSIADGRILDRRARADYSPINGPPNLSVIVQQLVQSVDYLHKEKSNLRVLARKLNLIPSMSSSELEELLPSGAMTPSSIQQTRAKAQKFVENQIAIKTEELKYCSFLIENCLYMLWCHLDYYMLRALPQKKIGYALNTSRSKDFDSSFAEVAGKVTVEDLSSMKQNLVFIFNDSFCKKLVDISEGQSSLDKGFLEALLRRIKKLIQFVPVK